MEYASDVTSGTPTATALCHRGQVGLVLDRVTLGHQFEPRLPQGYCGQHRVRRPAYRARTRSRSIPAYWLER